MTPSSSRLSNDPDPPIKASERLSFVTWRSLHGPSNENTSSCGSVGPPALVDEDPPALGVEHDRPAADVRAEGRDPPHARSRGERRAHQFGRHDATRSIEVVADDHRADAGPAQEVRETLAPSPGRQRLRDRVEHLDVAAGGERDDVADGPRAGRERLQRLVAGACPRRSAERTSPARAASSLGVLADPLAGLVPVAAGSTGNCRAVRHLARPRRGRSRRARAAQASTADADRERIGPASPGPSTTSPLGQLRHRVAEPEHQRQPDHDVELVGVAQRRERPVEQVADRPGEPSPEVEPRVPSVTRTRPREEPGHEEPAVPGGRARDQPDDPEAPARVRR